MKDRHNLKIVFVHPDLGIGGAERLVLDIAGGLSSFGHQVKFLTNHFNSNHAFDELKNGDYPVEVYGDWIPRSIFGRFHAFFAYVRMLYLVVVYILFYRYKDNPDLYFTDLIPVANVVIKFANEKVVYYCHHPDLLASTPGGWWKRLYRKPIDWIEMKATGKADIILVNSEYTASVFRDTFPQITKEIYILYPTIAESYQNTVLQLKEVKPIEWLIPEMNKEGEKLVFLSLNRFHPAKKLEWCILALDKLRECLSSTEWNKIYLVIAGGYDPQSSINAKTYLDLVNLTKQKNLDGKVVFLKSPDDNTKAELLNSCTCLLYSPVKEHFGIVPLEAMLVSKPVIAVNSGGPRETVDHGVTGYLCEPTPGSMAEFMARVVSGKSLEMGANGKRRLEEKFSHSNFKNCLQQILRKLVEHPTKNK